MVDMLARVDKFPTDGQTIISEGFDFALGGKGANQAISAARQGANVRMIGMLGNDSHAKSFLDLFHSEGIETRYISHSKRYTGLGMIMLNSKGENRITVVPGANYDFGLTELKSAENAIAEASIVLLQLELKPEVTYKAIELCQKYSVPIILNPAPAAPLPEHLFPMIEYFTPNEGELSFYSGHEVKTQIQIKDAVQRLLDKGVRNVVATLGSKGAVIGNSMGIDFIDTIEVEAIDTVGAGDSFNGALAARLVIGDSLRDATRYANFVGALSVTKTGAIPAIPRVEDVKSIV